MSDPAPVPTPEQLRLLKQAREAALLRKWTKGGNLTPSEMSEVQHLLPPHLLAHPPKPRPKYLHPPEYYAQETGYDRRNIFRWISHGREIGDPCPLDEPAQLLAWWSKHMKVRPPDRLAEYVARFTAPAGPAAGADAPASAGAPTPTATARSMINFADLEGVGLERSVQELRRTLQANLQLLKAAYENVDDAALTLRQRNFEKTLELLRKAEQTLFAMQKERGELAPVSEFRQDLISLASALRGMRRRMVDNICASLATLLTPEQLGLMRAAIDVERGREEALFRSARHWQQLPDGEIRPVAAA
jgi:hypothetical protein